MVSRSSVWSRAAVVRSCQPGKEPATWSPLEYGCHVRDVLLVQRERVLAARRVDRPSLDAMGRDERLEHDGYAEQDPPRVARQLTEAAYMFANDLARLGPTTGTNGLSCNHVQLSQPERKNASLGGHAHLHEVRHHLLDVRRQL